MQWDVFRLLKKEKIRMHATWRVTLENIMLGEKKQSQRPYIM